MVWFWRLKKPLKLPISQSKSGLLFCPSKSAHFQVFHWGFKDSVADSFCHAWTKVKQRLRGLAGQPPSSILCWHSLPQVSGLYLNYFLWTCTIEDQCKKSVIEKTLSRFASDIFLTISLGPQCLDTLRSVLDSLSLEKQHMTHLAKRLSDLKQNVTQETTQFSGTVSHTLLHGVLRFVASVSFILNRSSWLAVKEC